MGGRKTFAAFDIFEADDVNEFLSDQAVMRFADAAARDAAIPLGDRVEGMIAAVAATDNGAPRFWDGSAWTLVSQGVTIANPLLLAGDPLNTDSVRLASSSPTSGTWNQISADLGVNAFIYEARLFLSGSSSRNYVEIGTGAGGSEVVRSVHVANLYASTNNDFALTPPYGVYVPSGTRVAVRYTTASGTVPGTAAIVLYYTTITGGTQVQAGRTSLVQLSGTTYVELGATPPLAGGVEVTGFLYGNAGTPTLKIRFGLGAASSEVAVTGYLMSSTQNDSILATLPVQVTNIPPFNWTAGTRLAVQADGADTRFIGIVWRESLV